MFSSWPKSSMTWDFPGTLDFWIQGGEIDTLGLHRSVCPKVHFGWSGQNPHFLWILKADGGGSDLRNPHGICEPNVTKFKSLKNLHSGDFLPGTKCTVRRNWKSMKIKCHRKLLCKNMFERNSSQFLTLLFILKTMGRDKRLEYAASFESSYFFRLLYYAGTQYPIMGALRWALRFVQVWSFWTISYPFEMLRC